MDNSIIETNAANIAACKAFVATDDGIRIRDPFDATANHATVGEYIASATRAVRALRDDFAAFAEAAKTYDKAAWYAWKKRAKDADDALRKSLDAAAADFFRLTGLNAAETQFAAKAGRSFDPLSLRGIIRKVADEIDARIEAEKPAEPRHTYIVQIETTDSGLKDILKAADKAGAYFRYAAPQSDKAFKAIDKWFAENAEG